MNEMLLKRTLWKYLILLLLLINFSNGQNSAPNCDPAFRSVNVAEDTTPTATVENIVCTDLDAGAEGTLTYAILSGNDDSVFDITAAGVVRQILTVDYDFGPRTYNLVVRASDGGTPSLTYDVTLDVIITSANEFTPTMGTPMTVSVSEDTALGTLVAQLTPYDDDFDENFVPQSTIISIITGGDFFFVEPVTGAVYLRQSLDYETAQTHTVTLQIQDQGILPQKQDTGTLTIDVQDVNDNSPQCSSWHFSAPQRTETDPIDTDVQDLGCTDAESTNLRYVIETGDTLGKFKINHGIVKLAAQIDVDTEANAYTLVIAVKDRGTPVRTSTVTVEVFMGGVDDNPVVWDATDGGVYEVSVAENSPLGTFIAMIRATDADLAGTPESEISYGIEDSGSIFGIESDTGRIFLAQGSMDRDVQETHVISISAYQTGDTTNKILGNVTVTLTDVNDNTQVWTQVINTHVNDNTPVWTQGIYTVTIGEDATVNSGILTVAASDIDKDVNGQITYSITSGHTTPGCNFIIDGTTGIISPATSLDYESATSCELVLQARDSGSPVLSATSTAAITITGVNEFTPTFAGPYTTYIPEDTALGSTVYTVTATDGDSGADGTLTYSLTSHTTTFSIDEDTGKLVLVNELDRETLALYEVVVEAADKSTATKRTGTTTVTINIDDVNEFAPSCTPVFNVDATLPITVGDTVQALGCTDSDTGVNAQLTYSITSGNTNTDFAVLGTGDVVYNKQPTQSKYQLEILVSDSAAIPKSTSAFVVVNVETDPLLTNLPDTANIAENAAEGTVLFTVTGNAASSQKSFSLISGNGDNKFVIDKYTGEIMILSSLDRETTGTYALGIRISDVVFSRTADSSIAITVDDANDVTPNFASSFYDLSIAENLSLNSVIQNIAATDNDAGVNAALSYSITNGNGDGKFSVDASGQLTLVATLDAETTQSYTLTVEATDGGSSQLTGTTIVIVKVQNVDEFTPTFLVVGGTYTHSLAEDTTLGSLIFTVTAQDQDVNTVISYSITGGNDGSFVMDQSTGNIFLAKFLDREVTPSYSLTLTANNGQGDTTSATLDVTVTDTNDNDPEFTQNVYSMQVSETQALGAVIGQITVSDRDEGTNGAVTLSIVSGNTGTAFRLDNDNIEVNTALDYETVSKYVLLIKAEDQGAISRSVTATVVVDVTPIYTQPRFASTTPSVSITEVTALNTIIYDSDATASGSVEGPDTTEDLDYVILSGNADGKFSINVVTGEVLVIGSLDRDITDTYTLTIQASNRYNAALRDAMTLTMSLTDVNDNAPTFSSATYSFNVNEGVALNTPVGTVTATDIDTGVNQVFSYAISSGEGMTDFAIDSSTGLIKVNSALSASTRSTYALKITALDTGSPQQSSTTDVLITINDLNDQTPAFDQPTYNLQVSELVSIGQVIYILQASDGDLGANGAVSYRIQSGNNDLKFTLNSNDGHLSLANVLDRETTDNYNLVVIAEDAGSPQTTGTATVSITVTDANDNQPIFISGSYTVTAGRTDAIGTSLVQVSATDQDQGVNSQIEYYIVGGDPDNLFLVDQNSGQVTTVNELVTAADTYDVVIHAIDKGTPRLTSSATVLVTVDPPLSPSPGDFSFTVSETASVPSPIGTITPDNIHAPGATIHYTILSGNHNDNLAIGLTDGVIRTAKQLDYEDQSNYYLTINIADQNNPALVYNKRCHISLVDMNDNTPTFAASPITLSLVENSPVGYTVSTIAATDPDSLTNGEIVYSIDPTNTVANNLFTINNAGELIVQSTPDFELVPRIAFTLYAEDRGSPVLTGVTSVVVDLIDVNDDGSSTSTPSSASPFFSLECPTTADNYEVITTMTAADFGLTTTPSDTVRFITMGKGVFGIGETSGEFYVANGNTLSADTRYIMSVMVRVQTSDNNSTGSSALVRVDTMVPRRHMVVLRHSVSVSNLETQRAMLQVSLQNLFSADSRLGIWRIQGVSTSFRRRLLADESESIIYVVNDKSTDGIDGLEGTKSFMSQDNMLNVLRESTDGTPSSVLTTPNFATFPVTSVHAATGEKSSESDQYWPQTTVGIAVLSTIGASILLLFVILVIYFLCTRGRQYNFENDENHNRTKAPLSTALPEKTGMFVTNDVTPNIPSYKEAADPVYLKSKPVKAFNKQKNENKLDKQLRKESLNVSKRNSTVLTSPGDVPPKIFQDNRRNFMPREGSTSPCSDRVITPRNIRIESPGPDF